MAMLNNCHKLRVKLETRFSTVVINPAEVRNFAKYSKKGAFGLMGALAFGVGAAALEGSVSADELEMEAAKMPWSFKPLMKSYDHKALRRGFQVYKEVCMACHTMEFFHWRQHIDVTHTKAEIKAMSAEYMYEVLNDDGDIVDRPGTPQDAMPAPYPNEIKARLANNGAVPPEMAIIILAREGGADYLFHLLNGYEEIPAGQKDADEGTAYNPYMHGGFLAMPQQIYNETVDYEDGTIAYQSQIAKDVCEYLCWTSDPFMDSTKLIGLKACTTCAILVVISYLFKRQRHNHFRTRQLHYVAEVKR